MSTGRSLRPLPQCYIAVMLKKTCFCFVIECVFFILVSALILKNNFLLYDVKIDYIITYL